MYMESDGALDNKMNAQLVLKNGQLLCRVVSIHAGFAESPKLYEHLRTGCIGVIGKLRQSFL